jgi:hypothetical protein
MGFLHEIDLFLGRAVQTLSWWINHEIPIALGMKEHSISIGELTVIKNQGRPDEEILCYKKRNLLTDAGRDKAHAQIYTNTSAGDRGAGFIAVTTDATAPADSDTTLTSEITTGGLARADASTKTHTSGTNSTTISHTFTASATHTGVQKAALFDASSSRTMYHENTFTATTLISSDTLTVTWTLTLDD